MDRIYLTPWPPLPRGEGGRSWGPLARRKEGRDSVIPDHDWRTCGSEPRSPVASGDDSGREASVEAPSQPEAPWLEVPSAVGDHHLHRRLLLPRAEADRGTGWRHPLDPRPIRPRREPGLLPELSWDRGAPHPKSAAFRQSRIDPR